MQIKARTKPCNSDLVPQEAWSRPPIFGALLESRSVRGVLRMDETELAPARTPLLSSERETYAVVAPCASLCRCALRRGLAAQVLRVWLRKPSEVLEGYVRDKRRHVALRLSP